MEFFLGFAPIAERFDGFILDVWGVVHDGVRPYPGAIDCLSRLGDRGKRVVMLSNAPRRSRPAREAMRQMGIDPSLYIDVITSGEAVHRALRDPPDDWWASLGKRVFHLGPARDLNVLDGLNLLRVHEPARADFVLNTGPDDQRNPTDLNEFEPVLRECAMARLPMICANPDLEVIRDGVRVLCAGALAARYQQLGGQVRSLGKPDATIYGSVLDRLNVAKPGILAVGDALRTDIAGAAAIGVASCWVLGGLHGTEIGHDREAAHKAVREAGLAPRFCVPRFTW